jgi:predicted transcriptional regulator
MDEKTGKTLDLITTILALLMKYGPAAWDAIKDAFGMTDEEIEARIAALKADPVKTADELLEEVKNGG